MFLSRVLSDTKPAGARGRVVPCVSVVMTVLNGEKYVETAIRSLMRQSVADIEIIVVDDGSTDGTLTILGRLSREDARIRIERTPRNLGPAGAANLGLRQARGDLIARMDADDISHPDRIEVQKRYMDSNPDVGLIGSSIQTIDSKGRHLQTSYRPRDWFSIRWIGKFYYPISHPSSMFRRRLPDGTVLSYDESFRTAMDYEFYARVQQHTKVVSIPEVLLEYRTHASSISQTRRPDQLRAGQLIAEGLQKAQLPPGIVDSLGPFNRAFLASRPAPPAQVFAGLRDVVRHDLATAPERRTWLMRQASMLGYMALRRSGLTSVETLRVFASSGHDFLPALGMKYAETKDWLPKALSSHPEV